MEDNYNKAFKEVVEILKHVPEESVQKIPQDMRDMFEEEMDKDYIFEVKDNVEFEDLKLLDETKAILANIFRDYWATPYQRERILAKEQYDRQKVDEEKQKKYNSNDLFKRKNINDTKEIESSNNENLPVIKKENRIIAWIKSRVNNIKEKFNAIKEKNKELDATGQAWQDYKEQQEKAFETVKKWKQKNKEEITQEEIEK